MRIARPAWTPLLLALLATPAAAQQAGAAGAPEPVKARLVTESAALAAGANNPVGVLLEMSEGWHVYAPCLNDSGGPAGVAPELPDGWSWQAFDWPAPVRLLGPGDQLDHVYEGRVLLAGEVQVPADAVAGIATLRMHAAWMACRSVCVLGEAVLTLDVSVTPAGSRVKASADAPLFEATRARTARPLPAQGAPLSATLTDGALVLHAPGVVALAFYPDEDGPGYADLLHEGACDGERLVLHLYDGRPAAAARGVVELRWPGDRPADFFRIDIPLPVPSLPGDTPRAPPSQEKDDAR